MAAPAVLYVRTVRRDIDVRGNGTLCTFELVDQDGAPAVEELQLDAFSAIGALLLDAFRANGSVVITANLG